MPSFQAELTPGLVTDIDKLLTLTFTDLPRVATDVNLKIMEADTWRVNGAEVVEGSKDDIIMDIFGFVKDGKFTQTLLRLQPNPPKGSPPRALLNIKIADADPVKVPINSDPNEDEAGFFEIFVEVTGKINGVVQTFKSQAPSYVRTQPQDRPVIAFITGIDNAFFPAAKAYWKKVSDRDPDKVNDTNTNLKAIMAFLRKNVKKVPWGEVDMVAHGTRFVLNLSRTSAEGAGRANGSEEIQELVTQRPAGFEPLDASVLDDKSLIVIRGCNIGHNPRYLKALKALFGGRAAVQAPLFLQGYEFGSRRVPGKRRPERFAIEFFQEQFFFTTKGSTKPSKAAAQQRLQADNPGISGWERMTFKQRGNRGCPDGIKCFPFTFPPEAAKLSEAELIALARQQWKQTDMVEQTTFDDWDWRRSANKVTLVGTRVTSEFRRDFTGKPDGTGPKVVPMLNDPSHYGRS